LGAWSLEPSRDRLLSALAGASSARRGGAAGGRVAEVARSVPKSGGRLESTSAPKLSPCCGWSGRTDFGGAVWIDALAAASDVTLNTGVASFIELFRDQQGPGHIQLFQIP
jgi:hypothetical protein